MFYDEMSNVIVILGHVTALQHPLFKDNVFMKKRMQAQLTDW